MVRNPRNFKSVVVASLLLFGAGTAATASAPAGDPAYCREFARDYCASIGYPGDLNCINTWTHQCELDQGRFAFPGLSYKRD